MEAEKRRNVDAAEECRRRFDILEAEKRRNVDTADEYGRGVDILGAEKRENVDITDKSMHQGDTSCQQYLNK